MCRLQISNGMLSQAKQLEPHDLENRCIVPRLEGERGKYFSKKIWKRCILKTLHIVITVTFLICGLTFAIAQQTSTSGSSDQNTTTPGQQYKYDATTGKKFVGKIVSIDHDAKTFTAMPIEVRTDTKSGSGFTGSEHHETSNSGQGSSSMGQGSNNMAEGTRTFKYNDDTKYHRDGSEDKDFRISDLDKGDDVVIQYDDNDNAIRISKLQPSEKARQ
jgi:hypothetical protein